MTKSRNLAKFPKTSAIQVPSGDTASRPSAANGYFRYNTTTSSFEGYSNGNWGAIGGSISAGGGLASWNVVSSNYTVGNNIQLLANSAAGSFTITLPASPVLANVVVIADGSGPNTGWSNNNVLVDPNGKTIQGIADNLALNISRSSVSLIYDGATWQVISTTGPKGADGAAGPAGAAGAGANATQTVYRFNATNNQTIFVGADAYSQTLSYNVNAIGVYLNGVYLRQTEDYIANNGTSITLLSPTLANDALDVVTFQSMSLTAAQNTITTYVYTASNNQTSFGGADINGNILNYNTNNLFVTLNGLTLRNGVDYLQSNSSYIALTSGAVANDELSIVAFGSFQLPGTANTISNYSYTTTAGQTTISGADSYGNTLSYNGGNLIVTRNGATLRNRLDYTALNGTSITLANPAYENDEIGVITFTSFITSANTDYRYLSKIADDVYTGNITSTATGYFQVPQGTTAQRPAATSAGLIRFNTSLGTLETANGTAWSNVGSGSASSGSGGVSWQPVQNSSFIAVKNNGYLINTFTGNVVATLPSSPTFGDFIQFVDYGNLFSSNSLILYPNGKNIGGNSSNISLTVNGQAIGLVYTDNNKGWINYSSGSSIGNYLIDYLSIAGGGGGGSGYNSGGGGAGGMLTGTTSVTAGVSYTITIGSGGAGVPGVPSGSPWPQVVASSGTNSSIGNMVTSTGGGGGASNSGPPGVPGGSGGGGCYQNKSGGAGTAGQGNPGGSGSDGPSHGGGGGGGAGGSGSNGTTSYGGTGGPGLSSSLSGTSTTYAGGGGGGTYFYNGASTGGGPAGPGGSGGGGPGGTGGPSVPAGGNGTSATGSGGGGGAGLDSPTASGKGGNGGSGLIIIRYLGPQRATGGTVTISGGYTMHTFTTSGTFIA